MNQRPYTVVLLVPTGVGAEIGGYGGDAIPVARTIASVADRLITHPNVLNGAVLYWPIPNAFYVEGYGLDRFAAGSWGLRPVHRNRVGLLLDQGMESDLRLRQLQAADAARATLGLDIAAWTLTDAPLEVELRTSEMGASWGTIGNPDSLLRGASKLIREAKAEAIAVVARFPDDADSPQLQQYRYGGGTDPISGAEAVISHLVVRTFHIPCAHSPALEPLPLDAKVSPRAAAEELGYTFLPSVLVGLSRAPQFITSPLGPRQPGDIWAEEVDAVVIPATAAGGSALLSFRRLPAAQIIAVGDNQTQVPVSPADLGIKVLQVNSYLEALGVLVAHRAGVSPSALVPHIPSLPYL